MCMKPIGYSWCMNPKMGNYTPELWISSNQADYCKGIFMQVKHYAEYFIGYYCASFVAKQPLWDKDKLLAPGQALPIVIRKGGPFLPYTDQVRYRVRLLLHHYNPLFLLYILLRKVNHRCDGRKQLVEQWIDGFIGVWEGDPGPLGCTRWKGKFHLETWMNSTVLKDNMYNIAKHHWGSKAGGRRRRQSPASETRRLHTLVRISLWPLSFLGWVHAYTTTRAAFT